MAFVVYMFRMVISVLMNGLLALNDSYPLVKHLAYINIKLVYTRPIFFLLVISWYVFSCHLLTALCFYMGPS